MSRQRRQEDAEAVHYPDMQNRILVIGTFTTLLMLGLPVSAQASNAFANPSTGGDRPQIQVTAGGPSRLHELMHAWSDETRSISGLLTTSALSMQGASSKERGLAAALRLWSTQNQSGTTADGVRIRGRLLHTDTGAPVKGLVLVAQPGVDARLLLKAIEKGRISEARFARDLIDVAISKDNGIVETRPLPKGVRITLIAIAPNFRPETSAIKLHANDPQRIDMVPLRLRP